MPSKRPLSGNALSQQQLQRSVVPAPVDIRDIVVQVAAAFDRVLGDQAAAAAPATVVPPAARTHHRKKHRRRAHGSDAVDVVCGRPLQDRDEDIVREVVQKQGLHVWLEGAHGAARKARVREVASD